MENLGIGLQMTLQGMGTTFLILIIFYFMVKGLSKLLPEKSK